MRLFTIDRVFTEKESAKDFKSRITFSLDDVDVWEEYVYTDTFKDFPGPKTWITISDSTFICLISFDEFDTLMKKERSKVGINLR